MKNKILHINIKIAANKALQLTSITPLRFVLWPTKLKR
jgi:hypothetical protein